MARFAHQRAALWAKGCSLFCFFRPTAAGCAASDSGGSEGILGDNTMKSRYVATILATASMAVGATIPLDDAYLEEANSAGTDFGHAILMYARTRPKAHGRTMGISSQAACPGAGCFGTGWGNFSSRSEQLVRSPFDVIDLSDRRQISNTSSGSVHTDATGYGSQRVEGSRTSASSEEAGWRDTNTTPNQTIGAKLTFGWISEERHLSNSFGSGHTTSAFGLRFPDSIQRSDPTRIGSESALPSGTQVLNQGFLHGFPEEGFEPAGQSTSEILALNHAPEPGYQWLLALGLVGLIFARATRILIATSGRAG